MILEHKGSEVFYSDQGKGSVVVLLHGFLENSLMWNDFIPEISRRHRVICFDLLGHGQTQCIGYVHSMELMAEAVAAVLNALKVRRSIFIGHSMGGYVALAFAENNPDAVKGLCLINSTAEADSKTRIALRNRAIEAVKRNYKNVVRMSISNLFRPKNKVIYKTQIAAVKKEALKTPLQGYIAAQEGMKIREDRVVLLHFSPYKKMMIIGKKDPVLDYNSVIEQTKKTNVAVVTLPDGHMSHIENKTELYKNLVYFIEKM